MRPLKNLCEIAVIGGGLAGLAAARHAARLGRLVTLFEGGGLFGGLVANVGEIDGLPFPGRHSGQDMAMHLLEDARKVGVRVADAAVAGIELGGRLSLSEQGGTIHQPEAIILASGASLRILGIAGEEEFHGRGVSRCATCDGGFFRGQDVVVVGGGDAAVHEALELAKLCARVTMICRGPLKAMREHIDKLEARENVVFLWDSEVTEILGEDGVTGVRVRNVKDGVLSSLACTGVFPFIGVAPNTNFVPNALLADTGHIATDANLATADARVFAAGAVRAGYGGALVQAMAEGVQAAQAAARAISGLADQA